MDTRRRPRREVAGAWFVLGGYITLLFGLIWDGQWHNDVGPDTFVTAPHLLLYTGTAIMGLTCLTVVLRNTFRPGDAADRPAVTVFGVFRAPAAFLVGGVGAAGNLLYGAADLWWHDVYGFDIAQGTTPSHLGLALSIFVELVGVVMAFAVPVRTRADRWGLAAVCAIATMGSTQLASALSDPIVALVPSLAPHAVFVGAVGALLIGLAAGIARDARWLLASALVFVVVQGTLILFSPAATRWYADAIGMPFRDYATNLSPALLLPFTFPLAAVLGAGLVTFARRRGLDPPRVMAVLGAVTGLVIAVLYVLVTTGADVVLTLVTAAVLAAVAGRAGWRLAGNVVARAEVSW